MRKGRKYLEKALMSSAPISLLPSFGTIILRRSEDFQEVYEQWMQQNRRRNGALKNALKQVAASLKLSDLSVRVLAERIAFETKSVERQFRPPMVVLQLKLQGKAKCDYRRQIHTMPINGKVRFTLSNKSRQMPPILEQRHQLWKNISR